jgi:sensor histidine kinase YesM
MILLTLALWAFVFTAFLAPGLFFGKFQAWFAVMCIPMNLFGVALSPLVYLLVRRTAGLGPRLRPLVLFSAVITFAVAHSVFDGVFWQWFLDRFRPGEKAPGGFPGVVANSIIVYLWVYGFYTATLCLILANLATMDRERQLAAARAAASEANAAASAARLAALRYQLNPHFLFNTLNAVSSAVITGRNQVAEAMLEKLSEFLRVTLAADPEALIPLEDELATLQAYLEIESVRFRDRLAVEFTCPKDLRAALIPSFLLQPLIENAVKFAVAPTSATVTIRVEAVRNGEELVILVEDNGAGPKLTEPRPGQGVGLRNIRARLEVLYGRAGALEAAPREHGFLAMIRLPLQWTAPRTAVEAA